MARAEHVRFLDLHETIARRYDELGPEKVEPLFADEHTHTSRSGAELNAELVIAALKALQGDPLAPYLSAKPTAGTRPDKGFGELQMECFDDCSASSRSRTNSRGVYAWNGDTIGNSILSIDGSAQRDMPVLKRPSLSQAW